MKHILFINKCCGKHFDVIKNILKELKDNKIDYQYSSTNSFGNRAKKLLTKEELEDIFYNPIIVIDGVKHKARDWSMEWIK